MSLGTDQELFAFDFASMVLYAYSKGDTVRLGEVQRPQEMQQIYVQTKRSKTMHSQHLLKCAGDIFIFRNGKLLNREEMKEYGDWWESKSPRHRWGGSWRGLVESKKSSFIDVPHFELK
jgi:hypothetical protein